MNSTWILIVFLLYTILLIVISRITSRNADNESFFRANRSAPWYLVAYGMIGASLSGVTFISVPGWVVDTKFSYMMMVAGYLVGYAVIALVLLPVYYRLNLTSIYTYIEKRFGRHSYKTASSYFLLSRTIGASFRMFLVANVLHLFVFQHWGVPFALTVAILVLLIMVYTLKGGIKTIVWTDTLQTTFMIAAVLISVSLMLKYLDIGFLELVRKVSVSENSQIWFSGDWGDKRHFLKQFIGGMFIAIAMTGLDQDMMQKNLSCRTLKDSQKNVLSLSWILVPVNLLFLFLGAALILYIESAGIKLPEASDDIFPTVALMHLGPVAGITFLIGLVAAAYSSADSALTSLTTAFSIDILDFPKRNDWSEEKKIKIRRKVHFSFAALIWIMIVSFKLLNNDAVISKIFTIAGYTYGPLLGFFAFGLFTKFKVNDRLTPYIAVLAPIITFLLDFFSEELFMGYRFGFELLLINGLLTFLFLFIASLFKPSTISE